MSVSFDANAIDGVLVCTVSGNVVLDDLLAAAQTMWGLIGHDNARVLVDLVDARFDLRAEEVAQLANFARRKSPLGSLRMVFLLATDLEFGLVRMFQSLRDTEGTEVLVVRDRARALALVKGETGDDEPDQE